MATTRARHRPRDRARIVPPVLPGERRRPWSPSARCRRSATCGAVITAGARSRACRSAAPRGRARDPDSEDHPLCAWTAGMLEQLVVLSGGAHRDRRPRGVRVARRRCVPVPRQLGARGDDLKVGHRDRDVLVVEARVRGEPDPGAGTGVGIDPEESRSSLTARAGSATRRHTNPARWSRARGVRAGCRARRRRRSGHRTGRGCARACARRPSRARTGSRRAPRRSARRPAHPARTGALRVPARTRRRTRRASAWPSHPGYAGSRRSASSRFTYANAQPVAGAPSHLFVPATRTSMSSARTSIGTMPAAWYASRTTIAPAR